jgi:hypothetical protein
MRVRAQARLARVGGTLYDLSRAFPRYVEYDPLVPVWCVTPGTGRAIHRFFDTSPFSPSGRYLALTRLPFEDRLPAPGDVAEIVVVDLETGEERTVAESRGWDTQLGAQAQWGATDGQLLFNDLDTARWRPFGVVLDPTTGRRRELDGTVYTVSPDGRWAASPCLLRTAATQPGYGVIVPREHLPRNQGASAVDGLYLTQTESGRSSLLVSFKQILEQARPRLDPAEYAGGDFYGFHVKWNPQGDRLLLVLRWVPRRQGAGMRSQVITMAVDGTDVRVAIPAPVWDRGGHHPTWQPDGRSVMMNLRLRKRTVARATLRLDRRLRRGRGPVQATGLKQRRKQGWGTRMLSRAVERLGARDDGMRLVSAQYDGSRLGALSDTLVGTGHPSLHPDGRHVLTDAYPSEPVCPGDGTAPIRLLDLQQGREDTVVRIHATPDYAGPRNELRVDPHPTWDRDFRRIAFNGWADGTRRVYVADLTSKVG